MLQLTAAGTPVAAAVWTAIASYPYLFLAAFMVSEPRTAAPRRRQRILVGAVIGVAALVPVHLGPIAASPELALLVGNLVAFGFGPRARVRLTLARRRLESGVLLLEFAPERPLRFRAGQYVELTLPHRRQDGRGARRVFSAASSPLAPELAIATRMAEPGSSFKQRLAALEPGAVVAGAALQGDFLPPERSGPQLWLAGGIGITPFAAFADDLARRDGQPDVVLVHVVRGSGDLLLTPAFVAAGVRVLIVGPALVEPMLPPGWARIADSLTGLDLAAAVPDAASRWTAASGSPGFVRSARALAHRAGIRRVRADRFLGA